MPFDVRVSANACSPLTWLLCILGAYLIGSIPFGVIIARTRGIDIREHGSRNIGATNVGRVLGRKWGALCFVLDVLKGAAPVLITGIVHDVLGRHPAVLTAGQMWWWMGVAAAAVLGHMHSLFLGFTGGKGVATGFGTIVAMWQVLTWPALAAIVIWYFTLRVSRYVSLSSMLAALSLPVTYLLTVIPPHAQDQALTLTMSQMRHAAPPFIGTLAIALLVVWKHRSNIARLRRGKEPKVGRPT
jgi:glycerol-3-phosphate acyltransferase PlsY